MAYYIDLFSPETYQQFLESDRTVSGFREGLAHTAEGVQPGDILICYVTRLSRWVGALEVVGKYYVDDTPVFTKAPDPFTVRFKVKPLVCLPFEKGIPMSEDLLWNELSFTKKYPKGHPGWTVMVRGSLRRMGEKDGSYLQRMLVAQGTKKGIPYPLTEQEQKKLKITTVKTQDSKEVPVSIPENEMGPSSPEKKKDPEQRESIQIQALLAEIGQRMGMKIWIPRSDRQRVVEACKNFTNDIPESLPLNYDTATLKTIENIDVLWIKGRTIVRAFEVEHTTSIYSGILRMADLMALQPNINIKVHIVAPVDRKEKVMQEITRPVFAFLDKGPLAESCSFLAYDSIRELAKEKKLEYMTDAVLQEYEEFAEANI